MPRERWIGCADDRALILCVETGTDTCSVALAADGRIVALSESHGKRDHAARVAVYASEVLKEAGCGARDLAAIAVSKGPGSYTGLRIGVSLAKGLAYGLGIPMIGIGSLESLCAVAMMGGAAPSIWVPMIDARRMEVYTQIFGADGAALTGPEALVIDEGSLADWRCEPHGQLMERSVYIFGSGAEKCRQVLPWAHYLDVKPSARGMAALAQKAFTAGDFVDTTYFEPLYLKDFVVTTSQKKLF